MTGIKEESYISLNALTQFRDEKGHYHFESDKEAVASYMEEVIAPRRINFNSLQERLDYLVQEKYYDPAVLASYDFHLSLIHI